MPITRREPGTSDPIEHYVAIIWNSKWIIIAVMFITAIVAYAATLTLRDSFRVKSEIFVNRLTLSAEDETPNPETVTSLLKSQSVIEKVRNDFAQTFNVNPAPKLEEFAKAFDVKSFILQDTTVKKQYSPVLSLQVDAQGSSETRYIMNSWIQHFIKDFGNYTTQEAVAKKEALFREKARLEADIQKMELKRSMSDAKLPFLKRMLAEKLDLLTPSRLQFVDQDVDTAKMEIKVDSQYQRTGLLERLTDLELDMQTAEAPATGSVEIAALQSAISDAKTSITEAEGNLANARYEQLQTIRLLQQLSANQTALNDAISKFTVTAAVYNNESSDLPAGGDIRALAMPVYPEMKIWPKRMTIAAMAALLAGILTIGWIFARNFLTKLSAPANQ